MKLKDKYNKKFKILSLDGGGLKGTIFLVFLKALEEALGKKCHEIFDIIMGTSTGGITAGLLAAGLPADKILDLYVKNAKKIFKKRFLTWINPLTWIKGSRYDRTFLDNLCKKYLNFPMKKAKCILIVTGMNMKDTRSTHFFKSYKPRYANVPTYAPVMATYSATSYFGYFLDKQNLLQTSDPKGGKWADGGIGVDNCTLAEAITEIKEQKKLNNYWILSCGCGYTGMDYDGENMIAQIGDFLPIAREQSIWKQISMAKRWGVNFTRIDSNIDKKHYPMDKPKYMKNYIEYGKKLVTKYLNDLVE